MKKKILDNRSTFYCFTPAVSLGTFIVEFLLAFYVITRYKMNNFNRIAVSILLCLGLFQLSEFMICKSDQIQLWGKIGTISITLLPVLGLHLIDLITQKRKITLFADIIAAIIVLSVLFLSFLNNYQCSDKYVTIIFDNKSDIVFTAYYFGFLLLGLNNLISHAKLYTNKLGAAFWMGIGYLSFIVPTALVYIFSKTTHYAIPSIMCGFALLFAIILVFKVIPEYNKKSKKIR